MIPTKKRPRSSTPDTGDLRPVVLQEVLADQMQMPLPTADRKFKFIEGDWFVRMPVSYSTSTHKKVWFFTARAGTITLAARDRVLWCTACGLARHCGPQCSLAMLFVHGDSDSVIIVAKLPASSHFHSVCLARSQSADLFKALRHCTQLSGLG